MINPFGQILIFMKKALQEAETAFLKRGGLFWGCYVVENRIICPGAQFNRALNERIQHPLPKMQAITAQPNFLGGKNYLHNCTLCNTWKPLSKWCRGFIWEFKFRRLFIRKGRRTRGFGWLWEPKYIPNHNWVSGVLEKGKHQNYKKRFFIQKR